MVKCYKLVRNNKPIDTKCYTSKIVALSEMRSANKQFKEFNEFIKKNKINRKPVKLVKVKEFNISRKEELFK